MLSLRRRRMTKAIYSIVAVIYDKNKDYYFLILKKKGTWEGWQFVQGAKEKEEDWKDAVKREVKEETGLDCEDIIKINVKSDYWFKWEGELIHKFLHYFLVKADMKAKIKLSVEHSAYKWADFETALGAIKFNKEQFKKAFEMLKEADK